MGREGRTWSDYLERLYLTLMAAARSHGVLELVEASFDYLPTRLRLDLRGVEDVYAY